MSLIVPQHLFRNVTRISPQFMKSNGIRGLVLDVDNTLAGHDSQELPPAVENWLKTMKRAGIRLMLASNNTRKRVGPFARQLGLHYVSFCCKPSPVWLLAAMRRWKLPKSAIALVGDQLFTDQLAGSLYGVRVLVVRPLYHDTKPTVLFKRKLEKPFLLRYYRRGGLLL